MTTHKDHNLTLLIEKISKKELSNNLKELKMANNLKSEEKINNIKYVYNNISIYYNICINIIDNYNIKNKKNVMNI